MPEMPRRQSPSGGMPEMPRRQSPSGNPLQDAPRRQAPSGNPLQEMPRRQSATGNPLDTPRRQSATGNPLDMPRRQSATGNPLDMPRRQSATGNPLQEAPRRQAATGNPLQDTPRRDRPTGDRPVDPETEGKARTSFERGMTALDEQRYRDARNLFQHAVKLHPVPAHQSALELSLGFLAQADGLADEARKQFAKALRFDPESPRALAAYKTLDDKRKGRR